MAQIDTQIENLILHAISVWQERMATLCYQEKDLQKYSFCPKRFIFDCACRFERKKIQRVLDSMVSIGGLSRRDSPNYPNDASYQITQKNQKIV